MSRTEYRPEDGDARMKESFGVTPPNADTLQFRAWIESQARESGWACLEWTEELDRRGNPMGRLMGLRPRSP